MRFIIEKRNIIILFIIILLFIWVLCGLNKKETYVKSFQFNDGVITIVIYDNINSQKITKDIKNIYNKYKNIDELKDYSDEDKKILYPVYVTDKVQKYLLKNKITHYMINENGNVIVGKKYKEKYRVSVHDANNELIEIVNIDNECLLSIKNRSYNTVSIISSDYYKGVLDVIKLQNMDIEDGKKYALENDLAVLWFDGNVTLNDKFLKYTSK